MLIVSWLAMVAYYVLLAFVFMMWARLIVDFFRTVRPDWRPTSVLLVLLNVVYFFTDPPLRAVRKFVKPVRAGAIALDFSWTIVLLIAIIAMYGALALA